MRFKLTKDLCYLAGLAGMSHEPEKSMVGIKTSQDELAERFIACALKQGVNPQKIVIEQQDVVKHVYFFHSKLARMIKEILGERELLPKKGRDLAAAYISGMFDASGHCVKGSVYFRRVERRDDLMLELMGVHTRNGKVINAKHFVEIIKEQSTLAKRLQS